jgi:hypothetical protein
MVELICVQLVTLQPNKKKYILCFLCEQTCIFLGIAIRQQHTVLCYLCFYLTGARIYFKNKNDSDSNERVAATTARYSSSF